MTAGSSSTTTSPLRGALLRGTTAFADREDEFRWLESYLDETLSGVPRIVLIEGDAGIGKTRLLRELRSLAIGRGVSVARGRAQEHVDLPYQVFAEALRTRILQEGEGADAILGEDAEAVRAFLRPSVGTPRELTAPTGSLSDPSAAGLRLAVTNAVIALARRRATLLVLDDLHWADAASLELLGQLAWAVSDSTALRGVPLMIAAAHRAVDRATDPTIAALIARLQREEVCRTLELAGVPEDGVRELLEGLLPGRPAQQLVESVTRETSGNPLFVRELLHHLVRKEAIVERGGTLVSTEALSVPLPADVVSTVSERVNDVSEGCRRLLSVASMIGLSFSLETLEAVEDRVQDELLPLLQEAERERLVESTGALFRFEHPLLRRVFQDRLPRSERAGLHVAIAEAIQKVYAGDVDDHDLEVAHHLIAAGTAADATRTGEFATRAGHRSFHNLAWGEAARFYAAAATACERAGGRPLSELAELHYLTGLSHYRNMDSAPALDHYAKAIELFRSADDVAGRARVQMERARVYITLSAVPYGEQAEVNELESVLLELPDSEAPLRGSISAQLAEIYWHARRTDQALDAASRAERLSESVDDEALRIYVSVAAGTARTQALRIEEALECYERALDDAKHLGDIWIQGWPLQRLPMVQLWLGRLADSEQTAAQACELARQSGDWGELSLGLAGLLAAKAARGAFDEVVEDQVECAGPILPFEKFLILEDVPNKETISSVEVEISKENLVSQNGREWLYRRLVSALLVGLARAR